MMMDEPMFQTKICGITSVEDALVVARAGADAIGLNFYARSPRYVTAATAANIVKILPAGISKVGLFVDTPAGEICRLFDHLQLDLIQLHGDQPPEFLAQLGLRPVMRAFRIGPEGTAAGGRISRSLPRAGTRSWDWCCWIPLLRGSTAARGRWPTGAWPKRIWRKSACRRWCWRADSRRRTSPRRFGRFGPAAVDVASGVESRPGRKAPSPGSKRSCQAARMAFHAALRKT